MSNKVFEYIKTIREDHEFTVLFDKNSNEHMQNFWVLFSSVWEPWTLDWIKNYSNKEKAFLDIGAWIGPTSLWASKFNKTVYSFEPDPVAFNHLKINVEKNTDNVLIYNSAVTDNQYEIDLFSRSGLGSSMSSVVAGEVFEGTVAGTPIKDILKLDDFGLIKIDIEGSERLIIDSFVENLIDPTPLIFSFHAPFYQNPEDVSYIAKKLSEKYSTFILENGSSISYQEIPGGLTTVLCL